MDKDLNQKIQERAYEIWEQDGRTGNPEDHWLRAEQEVKGSKNDAVPAGGAEDQIIDKLGDFA